MRGRSRTIKPEIFSDEVLGDLERDTGLPVFRAFVGLICFADREGRFEWLPRALRGALLPCWDGDMRAALEALASKSYIVRYTVNGKDYGLVRNFHKHQTIHPKEAASVLPDPRAHGVSLTPNLFPETPNLDREPILEGSGRLEVEVEEEVGSEVAPEPRAGARVATDVPDRELLPHEKAEARKAEAPPSGTMPVGRHQFRDEWKPKESHRAYGLELGLTEAEMLERAEHCRLKLYPHPFPSEDKQFKRELLWLRNEKQTKQFREQRKANPHGYDENPGARRRPGDASTGTVFGSLAGGRRSG